MHSNSNDKTNFVIVLTAREKWNLFYRNFSLCEFDNYYIIFVIMIALGGIMGSIFFGYISDIYGRRSVIRVTLFIITITNIILAILSKTLDYFYYKIYQEYNEKNEITGIDFSFPIIISQLYAQEKIREQFRKVFNFFAFDIFILSAGLWPLLKSCMALLIENATGELKVLIGFRRYNFAFGGLPPLFASLILVNVNNFTLSFVLLSFINLLLFIFAVFFLEESVRYYYE
jgi:MFS family permease